MMGGTFNIRKPKSNSCEFYKTFYRCYSLMQINDIIMNELLSRISEEEYDSLIECVIQDGFDMDRASAYMFAMGVRDGSLEKRKKEDRGLDTSLFKELGNNDIEPLQWYLQINEFMQLYALCEQGCKDFLNESGFDISKVKEKSIIYDVFKIIQNQQKYDRFIKSIADSTNLIFDEQNKILFVWLYFTEIRNSFMHANGRITERFKKRIDEFLNKWSTELNSIMDDQSMFMSCAMHDLEDDFFKVTDSGFIDLGNIRLNFFRNFITILLEALDDIKKVEN